MKLRVGELAGAGAFQDALQQIPQFTGLFCQRLYSFITGHFGNTGGGGQWRDSILLFVCDSRRTY